MSKEEEMKVEEIKDDELENVSGGMRPAIASGTQILKDENNH